MAKYVPRKRDNCSKNISRGGAKWGFAKGGEDISISFGGHKGGRPHYSEMAIFIFDSDMGNFGLFRRKNVAHNNKYKKSLLKYNQNNNPKKTKIIQLFYYSIIVSHSILFKPSAATPPQTKKINPKNTNN